MEKRRDPLEGFDWVFKPESVSPPPDMEDDSFVRLFGSGPTMHDLDPITEVEPIRQSEPSFLFQALREHPRLQRAAMRTGLAMGAIVTGVTAAFITHSSATGSEAMPNLTVAPRSSESQHHAEMPKTPDKKKPRPTINIRGGDMTPISFSHSASASPTFIPRPSMPAPTVGETVDATARPPTSSAPSATTPIPSQTCTPSPSPSETNTATETPSPTDTESPSESPLTVETTSVQTETPQVSQSPSLGG